MEGRPGKGGANPGAPVCAVKLDLGLGPLSLGWECAGGSGARGAGAELCPARSECRADPACSGCVLPVPSLHLTIPCLHLAMPSLCPAWIWLCPAFSGRVLLASCRCSGSVWLFLAWIWLCLVCDLPSLSMSCPFLPSLSVSCLDLAICPRLYPSPGSALPMPDRAGGNRGSPGGAAAHRAGPDRGGGRGRAGRGAERLRSAGAGGVSEAAAGGGGSRSSERAAAPAPAPAPGTVRRAQVRAALAPRRSHRRGLGSRRVPAARRRLQSCGAGGGAARRPAIPRSRRGHATAGLGARCRCSRSCETRAERGHGHRHRRGRGCGRSGWHRGCSRRSRLPGARHRAPGERLGGFSSPR